MQGIYLNDLGLQITGDKSISLVFLLLQSSGSFLLKNTDLNIFRYIHSFYF